MKSNYLPKVNWLIKCALTPRTVLFPEFSQVQQVQLASIRTLNKEKLGMIQADSLPSESSGKPKEALYALTKKDGRWLNEKSIKLATESETF